MGGAKTRKQKSRGKKRHKIICSKSLPEVQVDLTFPNKYLELFLIIVLFCFGLYHSILYFGHRVVPNPDFHSFIRSGYPLWLLELPTRYARAPMVGFLQYPLQFFFSGQCPQLSAGWLLNAILHPFNLILLYLVGKRIVGRSALWIALISILNPWLIYLLTEPIAETPLLFFTLLTFYFMFKASNWSYFFASATMMIRYEGAALILAAFVLDMIRRESKQEKIRAFIYSVLASAPLALWMAGMLLHWEVSGGYVRLLSFERLAKAGEVLHSLYYVTFQPLLTLEPKASRSTLLMLMKTGEIFAVLSFGFGVLYGLLKRNWNILALLIFFAVYMAIHILYFFSVPRFYASVHWIVLLICWFGVQSCWSLINKDNRVPRGVVIIAQSIVLVIALLWLSRLLPYLPGLAKRYQSSSSIPYVGFGVAASIFFTHLLVYKMRRFWPNFVVLVLICLLFVSNQFLLAPIVGDGKRGAEFKDLATWFLNNAKPGAKLGCYNAVTVRLFASKHADYICRLPAAENPLEFVNACYENDITYVAWATREGLSGPNQYYGYRKINLDKNIALLREPRSVRPYQFITQVGSKKGYVNIFRLLRPPDGAMDR